MDTQLSLNLEIKYDASLSDFSGPGWAMVIDSVRQLHVGLIQQLYLFGNAGIGKSHLLSAICESYIEMGKSAITLSMTDLLYANTGILSSLENFDVIAIDDVEVVEHSAQWQEALFHLVNRSREECKQLIFAGNRPASSLPFVLQDLVTRLAQAPSFKLPDGRNIEDREVFLQSILRRRGWQFDDKIIDYLLTDGPYKIGEMMAVLNYIKPLFSNLPRPYISKAIITEAIRTIDEQTLLAELDGIREETQAEISAGVDLYEDKTIAFDF